MILGICNKEKEVRERIRRICEEVMTKYDVNYRIVEYETGNEVLDAPLSPAILVVDVDVPGIDGIQLKEYLEEAEKRTYIIFVTDNLKRMQEAFGINVLAFMEKSKIDESLPVTLKKVINTVERFVWLDNVEIDSRDVMYIKAEGVYCRFFMEDGTTTRARIHLNDLEEMLQHVFFVRIHRSLLINMLYIDELEKNAVYVQGQKYQIAVRRQSAVRKAYQAFGSSFVSV